MTDPLLAYWVVFGSCTCAVAAITFITTHIHLHHTTTRMETLMSELQDRIDAVTARLEKVEGEVVTSRDLLLAEIERLQNGEPVNLEALEAVAQRLDDLNEDAPAEEPAEEPVEEEPTDNE